MKRRSLSRALRFEVFKRDGFACTYCGAQPPGVVLHCDHTVPVCRGGRNEMENLRTACRDCNLGKGARLLEDRSKIQRQLELVLDEYERRRPDPAVRELLYIQGILRNRLGDRRLQCVGPLRERMARGVSLDRLKHAARQARDWDGFERLAGG